MSLQQIFLTTPAISILPEEILLEIFSYLSHYDLFENVRQVCTLWKDLSESKSLWIHLDVYKDIHEIECRLNPYPCKLLSHWLEFVLCNVSSLSIGRFFEWFVESVSNVPKPLETVKEFTLEFDKEYVCDDTCNVPNILAMFPNLQILYIHCHNTFPLHILEDIKQMDNSIDMRLRFSCDEYVINQDSNFNDDVFTSCSNFVHFQAYDISCNTIKTLLSSCDILATLNLSGWLEITSEAFEGIRNMMNVSKLIVDDTFIDDNCLRTITQITPNLKYLSFQICIYITDVGCMSIANNCKGLETFIINVHSYAMGRNITDVGIDFIAKGCRNLKILVANFCDGITDNGLKSISENCPKLNTLKVSGCTGITDLSAEYLTAGCNLLRILEFDQCLKMTERGVNLLIENCLSLEKLSLDSCSFIQKLCFSTKRGKVLGSKADTSNTVIGKSITESDQIEHLTETKTREASDRNELFAVAKEAPNLKLEAQATYTFNDKTGKPTYSFSNGCFTTHCYVARQSYGYHSHLKQLNLQFCPNVDDESVRQIADFCLDLRTLNFTGNIKITDDAVEYLLQKCKLLTELDLSGGSTLEKSKFTDKVLLSLCRHGLNLQQLNIQKNRNITINGIRAVLLRCNSLQSFLFSTDLHSDKKIYKVTNSECIQLKEELQSKPISFLKTTYEWDIHGNDICFQGFQRKWKFNATDLINNKE